MFVALKNWRERLRHQVGGHHPLLADADRVLKANSGGSTELLRHFRADALSPNLPYDGLPALGELGAQFVDAQPLSAAQNLSIMASVERGAARQARQKRRR